MGKLPTQYVEIVDSSGLITDLGVKADAAVIDPTASASVIAALKGAIKQLQGDGSGYAPVSLATSLSSEYDTINVDKMSKGSVTTAHNAISASVAEASCTAIDCRGFNSIIVKMVVASIAGGGTWTGSVYGASAAGETTGPNYSPKDDGTFVAQATLAIAADGVTNYCFRGVPNYVKIVPVLAVGTGTLTVTVTPMNL